MAATRAEVLRRAADVGAHERRRRVAGHRGLQAVDELVEGREAGQVRPSRRAGGPEVPVGMLAELVVALVRAVERVEEGDRVGDVDGDRDAELAGGRPQWVEPGIVDRHEAPRRVAGGQAQRLPDLEAAGAGRDARPEPAGLLGPEVGPLLPHPVVEAGEDGDAPAERLPARDLAGEGLAPPTVEVDDGGDARGVQGRPQTLGAGRRPGPGEGRRAEVVVGIDGGQPGLDDLRRGQAEARRGRWSRSRRSSGRAASARPAWPAVASIRFPPPTP